MLASFLGWFRLAHCRVPAKALFGQLHSHSFSFVFALFVQPLSLIVCEKGLPKIFVVLAFPNSMVDRINFLLA